MKGLTHSDETKQKMREKKLGANHPKFKGYYVYEGRKYDSLGALAESLGTYVMKAQRMFKKGIVKRV